MLTNILDILNVVHAYICTLVDIFYYTCSSDQQSPILSGFPTSLKEAQSQIFSIFFLRSRFSGEVKGALDLNSLLGTTSKGQQFLSSNLQVCCLRVIYMLFCVCVYVCVWYVCVRVSMRARCVRVCVHVCNMKSWYFCIQLLPGTHWSYSWVGSFGS